MQRSITTSRAASLARRAASSWITPSRIQMAFAPLRMAAQFERAVPAAGAIRAYSSQGLKMLTPRSRKSLTFRVTRIRPCSKAVAAIRPSMTASGAPLRCARAERTAQRSPIALVTGSKFLPKDSSSSPSNHCSNCERRWLAGRISIPRRISARVNTLAQREPGAAAFNQFLTFDPASLFARIPIERWCRSGRHSQVEWPWVIFLPLQIQLRAGKRRLTENVGKVLARFPRN